MENRVPMTRTRFDHIAIGLPRMAEAPAVLVGRLGGQPDTGGVSQVYNWGCWRYAGGGCIEILEPRGADGFLHRFLAQQGPGIHHVTFKVPSLREACDRAAALGYQVVGYDDSRADWKEAFLHPKSALGIVVQLAQVAGHGRRPWEPPPAPPDPPPPVRILGLRLRARSAERARRQWQTIVAGDETPGSGSELVYRWPDSPMRVAVEIDPAADEGPVCIEFAGDRAVSLPADGPLAGLFAQRPAP